MDSSKPVLAIETSQSLCGACVYYSEKKFFQAGLNLKYSHSEKLFELIDFVMKCAGIKINEAASVAVSAGPGSFTGLRIGMSAAKGIAYGASLPIIPVPTFEALALQTAEYLPENSSFIIANRVNVEEVYFAKFKVKNKSYAFTENLKVLQKSAIGKTDEEILIFGNALVDSDNKNSNIKNNAVSPSAKYIAKWSALFGKGLLTFDYDFLEPAYFKNFLVKERKNA